MQMKDEVETVTQQQSLAVVKNMIRTSVVTEVIIFCRSAKYVT